MSFFKKLIGNNGDGNETREFSDEEVISDFRNKEIGLEAILGKSSGMIGVSPIPFRPGGIGGLVDMYYYPNHNEGTGFATMQLLDPTGKGPKKNKFGTYELVAFTKLDYIPPGEQNDSPFRQIERRTCETLTTIGNESYKKVFNPNEICEFVDMEGKSRIVIFDIYDPNKVKFKVGKRKHHLLLCIEVFRDEVKTINDFGPEMFIDMLKWQKHYPYSDMDRNWIGERDKK